MTKKEKDCLFMALITILNCMKFRPLLDQPNAEEQNKRLDKVIETLKEVNK